MKDFLQKGDLFKFAKVDKYNHLCGKLITDGNNSHVSFGELSFQNSYITHYMWTEQGPNGWERKRNDRFDLAADPSLLEQPWQVIETSFGGGSPDGAGHSAGYPDGHHVTARTLDGLHTVRFYQSGSFIGMQPPENIELVNKGFDEQDLLRASPDDYWESIEKEILDAGKQVRHAHLLNHQAAHLLAWARIARDAAKNKNK
jgi:hypothetical protein